MKNHRTLIERMPQQITSKQMARGRKHVIAYHKGKKNAKLNAGGYFLSIIARSFEGESESASADFLHNTYRQGRNERKTPKYAYRSLTCEPFIEIAV